MGKSFDNIGIENFRVFDEKQNFKFADITILTGSNSSGKSSLINALKFLQASFKNVNENGVAIFNYLFNNIDHEFARKNFGALKGMLNRKNSSDSFFITENLNVLLFSLQLTCQVKYIFKFNEHKYGDAVSLSKIIFEIKEIEENKITDLFYKKIQETLKIDRENLYSTEVITILSETNDTTWENEGNVRIRFDVFYHMYKAWLDQNLPIANQINLIQSELLEQGKTSEIEKKIETILQTNSLKGKICRRTNQEGLEFDYIYVETLDKIRGIETTFSFESEEQIIIKQKSFNGFNKNLLELLFNDRKTMVFAKEIVFKYYDSKDFETDFESDFFKLLSVVDIRDFDGPFKYRILNLVNTALNYNSWSKGDYYDLLKIDRWFTEKRYKELCEMIKDLTAIQNDNSKKEGVFFFQEEIVEEVFGLTIFMVETIQKAAKIQFFPQKIISEERIFKIQNQKQLFLLQRKDNENIRKVFLKTFNVGEDIRYDIDKDAMTFKIMILRNGEWYNLKDEGYGIVKLIPLLFVIKPIEENYQDVFGGYPTLYIPQTVVLEEPESNLHPALQSKLADFIVEMSNKFNIQFIIETHSEYFIRKLQYLTAKKEIKPEKTQIYYFHHPDRIPEGEKQIYPINIREDGSLTKNFGNGFFDEAGRQEFQLYKLINQHLSDGSSLN